MRRFITLTVCILLSASLPAQVLEPVSGGRFSLLWLIATIAFVVAAAYVWISGVKKREAQKLKISRQMSELDLKTLRAQMNPHFIFNALNSIQDFILQNNIREAAKYLGKFAKLMRQIIDSSESSSITIARQIDFLKLYIEMESLRFDDQFEYYFTLDPGIDSVKAEIPAMLVQPFVENAIWHGLIHKEGSRELYIHFRMQDARTLICEVIDNGVGRARARELTNTQIHSHTSMGMKVTMERVDLLNQLNGSETSDVSVLDLFDENGKSVGTRVIIRMPFHTGREMSRLVAAKS